jgi:ubiquinone/menaquinone biosynthesis C-methylase UbiE
MNLFKIWGGSGKEILKKVYRLSRRLDSFFDKSFLSEDVPMSKKYSHENWRQSLSLQYNKPGMRILEIGSREVVDKSIKGLFSDAEYIGFDYHKGKNVDVVGDAHKLSTFFQKNEKFDLILSSAVFEHLAMPWIVSNEINKVLKIGGCVFIETHFSFSSHERPWHFFQFSDMALKVLFNEAMGFKTIEAGASNPIVGRFSKYADKYLAYRPIGGLYCHSEIYAQKVENIEDFDWNNVQIESIVKGTEYPLDRSV